MRSLLCRTIWCTVAPSVIGSTLRCPYLCRWLAKLVPHGARKVKGVGERAQLGDLLKRECGCLDEPYRPLGTVAAQVAHRGRAGMVSKQPIQVGWAHRPCVCKVGKPDVLVPVIIDKCDSPRQLGRHAGICRATPRAHEKRLEEKPGDSVPCRLGARSGQLGGDEPSNRERLKLVVHLAHDRIATIVVRVCRVFKPALNPSMTGWDVRRKTKSLFVTGKQEYALSGVYRDVAAVDGAHEGAVVYVYQLETRLHSWSKSGTGLVLDVAKHVTTVRKYNVHTAARTP
jgi:hypothetical protein